MSKMMEIMKITDELKRKIKDNELRLNTLQKNMLDQPKPFSYMKSNITKKHFSSFGSINYLGKEIEIKNKQAVCLRYFGMSIKEWSSDTRIIMFDISLKGESVGQYSINMTKTGDPEEWKLYKYHLPVGFPLDVIMNRYEIMTKQYFCSIHQALSSYHDRLWQINQLKKNLPPQARLNHISYSTLELIVPIEINGMPENIMMFHFLLQYDPFKTRPDDVNVTQYGVSYSEVITILKVESQHFHTYTLYRAFELIFNNSENDFYRLARTPFSMNMLYNDNNRQSENSLHTEVISDENNVSLDGNDENVPYCSNMDRNSIEHIQAKIDKGPSLSVGLSSLSVAKFKYEGTKSKKISKMYSKSSDEKVQNKNINSCGKSKQVIGVKARKANINNQKKNSVNRSVEQFKRK